MALDPRYPIGQMLEVVAAPIDFDACVLDIAAFPAEIKKRVDGLTSEQLAAQYRPGSWDVKTLVHHCADSHMHALIRTKWALTEHNPAILGYNEELTAQLGDYALEIAVTIRLLEGLHARFAALLRSLSVEQRARTYFHTGHQRAFSITETAAMYSWHCRHHLAHIDIALGAA